MYRSKIQFKIYINGKIGLNKSNKDSRLEISQVKKHHKFLRFL